MNNHLDYETIRGAWQTYGQFERMLKAHPDANRLGQIQSLTSERDSLQSKLETAERELQSARAIIDNPGHLHTQLEIADSTLRAAQEEIDELRDLLDEWSTIWSDPHKSSQGWIEWGNEVDERAREHLDPSYDRSVFVLYDTATPAPRPARDNSELPDPLAEFGNNLSPDDLPF